MQSNLRQAKLSRLTSRHLTQKNIMLALPLKTLIQFIIMMTFTYSYLLKPAFADKPKSVITRGGPICNLDQFTGPYIRVSKRRNGDSIVHIQKTGFIDMTQYLHVTICMNGPVVMYAGYEDIGPGQTIYKGANVEVYQHVCMVVNQIPQQIIDEIRRNSPGPRVYLGDLTLRDIPRESFFGQTVTGLQLIAQPEDFYKRTAKGFPMDNYGHISKNKEGVTGISFVTVGEGPFCLKLNDSMNVVIGGQPKKPSVCMWTFPDDTSATDGFINRYNRLFDGKYYQNTFHWFDCSLIDGFNPFPDIDTAPVGPPAIHDPFATYDPDSLGPPSLKTGNSYAEFDFFDDADQFLNTLTNLGYMGEDPDYDEGHPTMFPIRVDPSKCIPLNPKPTAVSESCLKKDKNIACTLLQLALHLIPPGLTKDEITLTGELAWKDEILNLIADIFSRVCLPFPKEMAFNVGRMFAYYLVQAHDSDYDLPVHRRSTWDFLKSELEMCRDKQIESDDVFHWHWDIREGDHDPRYLPGPVLTEEEQKIANLTKSTPCLALECSIDCIAVRDQCLPAREAKDYCSTKDEANCTLASQCIYNKEDGICTPIAVCEALDCFHADPKTFCETKRDKCVPKRRSPQPVVRDVEASPPFKFNPEELSFNDDIEADDPDVQFDEPIIYTPAPKIQMYVDPEDVMRYDAKYNSYPYNLFAITNKKALLNSNNSNEPNISEIEGRCVYHFEEAVETDHDLHIIIDAFWKITLTVFGYCNKHHPQRKQETFSRLYNTFAEDFLQVLYKEWANPTDNDELKLIFRGLNSDISSRWLDSCVETAFIVSDSIPHRIQRPLPVGEEGSLQLNYFTKYISAVEDGLFGIDRLSKASDGCIEF